uniref:Succinate dehydrogenase assembly factor 3 n=1 Tax=Arcella intermedia TaxID=1963864 RepID=A0A6B2LUV6_9EUKA
MKVLSLYRSILRMHQKKLPKDLRSLGDSYVRSEFKAIKKAKTPNFHTTFLKSWNDYLEKLSLSQDIQNLGKDLHQSDKAKLSKEQIYQLNQLKNHCKPEE